MKRRELRQIIREEYRRVLREVGNPAKLASDSGVTEKTAKELIDRARGLADALTTASALQTHVKDGRALKAAEKTLRDFLKQYG